MQSEISLPPVLLAPLDETRMIARRKYRRKLGCLLGLGVGLLIGLTSQAINPLLVPSVSLYQPPFGAALNILLATVIGVALGLATTWPTGSANGILLGAAAAALMMGAALFIESEVAGMMGMGQGASLGLLLLPMAGMILPVTLIFRLAVNRSEEVRRDARHAWQAVGLPVAVLLAAVSIGFTGVLPAAGRAELLATRQLIDENEGMASLPSPLQPPYVHSFTTRAQGEYTLEWTKYNLNRFVIPRGSLKNEAQHAVAVARFKNGYYLACLYEYPGDTPICRDWWPGNTLP